MGERGNLRRGQKSRLTDSEFRALIDSARERHNISDIVARHTTLKKRGRNEMVGLCCFHQERSPSLEVNDAKGTYHCHGCGAGGDVVSFLMKADGMTFRQAIETLTGDTFPTVSEEERAQRKADDARAVAERIELGRSIWAKRNNPRGTPAEVYARSRGITIDLPPTVGFVMTPRWRSPETGECGRDHPAMVCALQDVTGAVVGVQCIFLMDGGRKKFERVRSDGTKAKAKLTFGQLVGAAFRLGPVGAHIVSCEGPEDGLTLMQVMRTHSVWASCGTANLWQMQYPAEVQYLTLAGDNGAAGRNAVETAQTVYLGQGLNVNEVFPWEGFKDWNDQLRGIRS